VTDNHGQMSPQLFTTSATFGSVLLAIWVFVRLPRLRPTTFRGAITHIAVAYGAFHLAPYLIPVCAHLAPTPVSVVLAVAGLVLPGLCYMYVSWIWLFGLIAKHLSGRSGGGHLVRSDA
jgi:hypothetical protein